MTHTTAAAAAEDTALIGQSTNLVGLPTRFLASTAFNDASLPLTIAGVAQMNQSLFTMLGESDGPEDAALAFETYMSALFALDPEQRRGAEREGPRRYRASYHRLLRGWAFDSNGPEGAVLKGWVESRFGLYPTYHKVRLGRFPSPPWITYVEEKMSSRFHTNSILSQLDLLYTFCQWMLEGSNGTNRHLTLYRGVNDFNEHLIVERIDRQRSVLRLNNLVSFTSEREVASCFGDYILEAAVPIAKVLFYNRLLPRHALKGEGEYLVIGGDYRVTAHTM